MSDFSDCSDGGLAIAFTESCFGADVGATIDVSQIMSSSDNLDKWGVLYGESLGRIIVSVKPNNSERFENVMKDHSIIKLGVVGDNDLIKITNGNDVLLQSSMKSLKKSWQGTLNGGSQ